FENELNHLKQKYPDIITSWKYYNNFKELHKK
ncbi:TPA: DUF2972 domain-containing protein, partial [Campylobacter coli]|nr:DUF2972 domain-containing protein [Campylobacter coli]